ncbi:MAG: DUF4272 domain-containing protein [Methanomassiliicoccaceae archaeon]|nr:DUF4272 domain-containing protein [Methanomassiliicoccaceae archaeon]
MTDNRQAHITLYTLIGRPERVKESLTARFAEMTKEITYPTTGEDGAESIIVSLLDGTDVKVNINADENFIRRHIGGMYNFFAQIKCRNKELHQSVLRQIQVFNCVIGGSFELDDNEDRTNYIISTMFAVAEDVNGLVLMPDMRLLNHEGNLVLSADGKSDFKEYTPIGNTDFIDGHVENTPSDEARRDRSIAILKERGIPYLPQLPVAATESEAVLRSPEEMANRLFAMFAVCVYSEARSNGETRDETQKYLNKINDILGGGLDDQLTPQEKAFLAAAEPGPHEFAKFGWRYECCHVLMWALGVTEELGFPGQICDVPRMADILWRQDDLAGFLRRAGPRTKEDILDAADLILRYDWACVDARINGREGPSGLEGEVVYEWHYAFNWLIGYDGSADWDDIRTDT